MASTGTPRWAWALAIGLGTGLLVLCLRGIHWPVLAGDLRQARIPWLAAAVGIHLAVLALWAVQWKVFLPTGRRVSFRRMIQVAALTSMALNTVPLMAGHGLGAFLLSTRERLGPAGAVSVLSLDQLAKGWVKVTLLLAAALCLPLPSWMKTPLPSLVIGVVAGSAALVALAFAWRSLDVPGDAPRKGMGAAVRRFAARWARHLEALRRFRTFLLGLVLAFAVKGAEAAGIWAVQKAFSLDLPLWTVLMVLAGLNLSTMVSVTPGNVGVYEATAVLLYRFAGVAPETAAALSLMHHACYLLPMAGTGYLMLLRGGDVLSVSGRDSGRVTGPEQTGPSQGSFSERTA